MPDANKKGTHFSLEKYLSEMLTNFSLLLLESNYCQQHEDIFHLKKESKGEGFVVKYKMMKLDHSL